VRALLCLDPQEGEACNVCSSCTTLLSGGTHEGFEELDAATKSGKGDLARIIEDVSYSTFSSSKRIYLFDESHRLSKQALDVLLKPMEDSHRGSEDKKLVCIFCTTEPEKMSSTIFSRCAPAFVVRAVSPEGIAQRLAYVCESEGLPFELEALVTIAEASECHIRDALKLVEGVGLSGNLSQAAVAEYLHIGANDLVLLLLKELWGDLSVAVDLAEKLCTELGPSAVYSRIAEAALVAFRCSLGVGKVPARWNRAKIQELAGRGPELLGVCKTFAAPPHRPSPQTLVLDVGSIFWGQPAVSPTFLSSAIVKGGSEAPSSETPASSATGGGTLSPSGDAAPHEVEEKAQTTSGVYIDPRGIGPGPGSSGSASEDKEPPVSLLEPQSFKSLVQHYLRGLDGGREGRQKLGSP